MESLYIEMGPHLCFTLIKSPGSGVTLCFQFISTASTAAMTFASQVKTI